MVSLAGGLVVTPTLRAAQVSTLTFTFEPSVGILARKIDRLKYGIKDMRQPLRASVREVVIPSIQMNFRKGGRPRWTNLTEETWAQKGAGEKILIGSGALMKTMGYMNIWHIDSKMAILNQLPEKVWYGALHQAGHGGYVGFQDPVKNSMVNIGTPGLPARPFVMLQEEDIVGIEAVFSRWMGREILQAGL